MGRRATLPSLAPSVPTSTSRLRQQDSTFLYFILGPRARLSTCTALAYHRAFVTAGRASTHQVTPKLQSPKAPKSRIGLRSTERDLMRLGLLTGPSLSEFGDIHDYLPLPLSRALLYIFFLYLRELDAGIEAGPVSKIGWFRNAAARGQPPWQLRAKQRRRRGPLRRQRRHRNLLPLREAGHLCY